MPDTPAAVSMWTTLISVIVGGVIGVGASFIGPWFVEKRKEAAEKKKRRAEKFEELVATLFDYEHWLDVIKDMELYTKADELVPTLPPSPFGKLHAISAVYFPQFESKILELETAGSAYKRWMLGAREKYVKGEKDHTAGFKDAYGPFLTVSRALLIDLRSYAQREFQ